MRTAPQTPYKARREARGSRLDLSARLLVFASTVWIEVSTGSNGPSIRRDSTLCRTAFGCVSLLFSVKSTVDS